MIVGWWLAAVCAFTPDNVDDVGGPLRLHNAFPFSSIFLSTPPLDARVPRRRRIHLELGLANTYAYADHMNATAAGLAAQAAANAGRPGLLDLGAMAAEAAGRPTSTLYIADLETIRLDVIYTQPFGRRWLLEVEAPIYYHTGGFMDGPVEFWHGAFGFSNGGRDLFRENQGQLGLARGGSAIGFDGDQGPGLGDVVVRGLRVLAPADRGWPTVSVSGALKLPTGDVTSVFGSGTWEYGAGLHATHQIGQSWLYGTLGYNVHTGWRGMSTVPLRNTIHAHLGYEYRVSPEWSWLFSLGYEESPIRASEPKALGRPATLYGFAARYNGFRSLELEWGFIENIVRNNNTHDFGVYGRVRFWP